MLLADLRKAGWMTQKQLADRVGVTIVTIKRWESGQYPPDFAHRQKLAQLWKMTPKELDFVIDSTRMRFLAQRQENEAHV